MIDETVAKNIIDGAGLVGAILFIVGLKRLSNPATARAGNQMGIAAMVVAVLASLIDPHIHPGNFGWIFLFFIVPAIFAWWLSKTVAMTAMPQMVAFFNGMGGGAAALVSAVEFVYVVRKGETGEAPLTILLGTIIGAITLTGSIIAWGKLQTLISGKPITYPGQKVVNGLLWLGVVVLAVWTGFNMVPGAVDPNAGAAFGIMMLLAALIGIGMVLPIGGADMPVVISLLNSFTGLACALTGFSVHSYVLVIAGMLVGASGTLLTLLMCKAMNRSLGNVLFGAFGGGGGEASAAGSADAGGEMKEITVEDLAPLLAYSHSVIVVPGYGMAVAQAQQTVRELTEILEKKGVEVKYAIHPVAGRMPGHMNVLLAEANVPYPQLFDMEDINPDFEKTDVALVIGANDVTNPSARSDPKSPIYGMPILDVDKAKTVVVMKRGRGTGFAGVDNILYGMDNTRMLFGDAKQTLTKLVQEVKTQ
ncbi:MAG TPA: NAD(P)(+) transhydrogenase (Re/Si-specific) subunit beta [Candidatus Xenobia bacterium]|jgi:NAD(P) transhydrogenase subunit beta